MTILKNVSAGLLRHWWAPALVAAATCAGACHHHHDYDNRDRVVVVDEHGYRHEGYYGPDRHWHGGWYDEHSAYHDDPYDWRR